MRAHVVRALLVVIAATAFVTTGARQSMTAQTAAPARVATPEEFFGFRIGTDNKLARWDKIVEYMRQVAGTSDRVRFRELGKTTNDNPFIALEISAPENLKNLDRYKQLQRRLYFQGGMPTDAERDEIFASGQAGHRDHVQHPRDRDRRFTDGGRARSPAGHG